MSISRKLIETLIENELNKNSELYFDLDKDKITELSHQAFLIQVTRNDAKEVRKGLVDKIEHFNSVMQNIQD